MFSFLDYIKNFYTLIITISGIIAFIALVVAGILYLTSAGDPEKINKAKKQIFAAFLGVIIILSSYLILKTINPSLISFSIPGLERILLPPPEVLPPIPKVPDILSKIKEIAERIKIISEEIEFLAKEIKELTDKCDCGNTQSLCMCTGGEGGSCQPRRCYAGPTPYPQPALETGFHPCLDVEKIKTDQQRIIALRFELLYYKNRASAEAEDLILELENLERESQYYQGMQQIETEAKLVEYYRKKQEEIDEEKNLKTQLLEKLNDLISYITMISKPIYEIATLPDNCLTNVKDSCNAHCDGGCHDIKRGCQPAKCDGGNPCPVGEIKERLGIVSTQRPLINQAYQDIVSLINEIKILKTIYI